MYRDNFHHNISNPKGNQEQAKYPSKIKISPNIDPHEPFSNNMPGLGANFDFSRSIDFCGKNSMQNSFYSQWEIDADDMEEKKILEDLRGPSREKKIGNEIEHDIFYARQKLEHNYYFESQKLSVKKHLFSQGEQMEIIRPSSDADEFMKQQKAEMNQRLASDLNFERPIEAVEGKTLQINDNIKQTNSPSAEKSERLFLNTNRSLNKTVESEIIQCCALSGKGSPLGLNRKDNKEQKIQPNKVEEAGIKGVFKKYENNPEKIVEEQENLGSLNDLSKSGLVVLKKKYQERLDAITHIQFNVMVVGASGLGKSTFIDAFLNTKYNVVPVIMSSTEEIVEKQGIKACDEINFKINLIDTPGYGMNKSPDQWYSSIKGYLEKKFIEYHSAKVKAKKLKRSKEPIEDKRVHAILYFLSGPRISDTDLIFMKKFQKYGNLIPVIAKGDSYSQEEILEAKRGFFLKTSQKGIEFFNFNEALQDDPLKLSELMNGRFGPCPPFVIISSLKKIEVSPGKFIYGREFPWGLCNIENPLHSDFMLLRTLLGGHVCQEAMEQTNYYYKNYLTNVKEKQKMKKEKVETTKKIGLGAIVVVGLVGAFFAADKKILK